MIKSRVVGLFFVAEARLFWNLIMEVSTSSCTDRVDGEVCVHR
jgi:hypothetical protein